MRRSLLITSVACVLGGCATAKERPATLTTPTNVAEDGPELYFVDGREVNRAEATALPRHRIASIEVIKGSEATARYGARGQHGVIEITTKQPRS